MTPTLLGTADWFPRAGGGTPSPSRATVPLAPSSWRGWMLTQVPLPHLGMLVLGPRQCGNRIRAARQAPVNSSQGMRAAPVAGGERCRGCGIVAGASLTAAVGFTVSPFSPGKGKSLQLSLIRGLGTAHHPATKHFSARMDFRLASDFVSHPKEKSIVKVFFFNYFNPM